VFEEKEGVKVHRVDGFLLPDPINMSVPNVLEFWKKLEEIKSDIVIINKTWFITSLLASVYCKLYNKKYYVQLDTIVGLIWFSENKLMNAAMWLYARTVNRQILKWAKGIIVYHKEIEKALVKWKMKSEVISQGVDVGKFCYAKPSREVLDFKGERVCFVFVGRLDEIKRWKEYVETCKKVLKKRKEKVCFCFVCGAKHPEEQVKLRESFGGDDGLVFGYCSDVQNVMRACDVFVLPSKSEGMPDVVMEAMSSKLAIISSRVGGVPELIKDNESGFLFDTFEELEKKMILLADYKSRREAFAKEAFTNVQIHDKKIVTEKLVEVLNS
jgi:glycosyltransferase involved in cell wall biosynthesis